MPQAKVTSNGLKKEIKKRGYDSWSSLAEYVWNGFDAGASQIKISTTHTSLGGLSSITISDNGHGISDPNKFNLAFESDKKRNYEAQRISSLPHGKDGLGRFTFFTFSSQAIWQTCYRHNDGNNYKYQISINASSLLTWEPTEFIQTNDDVGTTVIFTLINADFTDLNDPELINYLTQEFAWFLHLNKNKGCRIYINDLAINYEKLILESSETLNRQIIEGYEFDIEFIQWSSKLNAEYSRYYFIDSLDSERYSKTTTLNNKGDDFFHSIFIRSNLFDEMANLAIYESKVGESNLFQTSQEGYAYKKLNHFLENYLHDKRRPFLETTSSTLIVEFEKQGVFPKTYDENNELDQFKKSCLYRSVKELYQVQPKLFTSLSLEQKKIFVRFLEIIQSSGKSAKILDVLKDVMALDAKDLDQLAKTLKSSKLANIIKTIQLIEDRCKFIRYLDDVVFKVELNANEREHIQKMVETNYWIFGEKYHLVSAEEPDFEAALRGYLHLLRGKNENEEDVAYIDDPGKKKQMDIFMCRKNMRDDSINHIVVELKHPKVLLGMEELNQVEGYMSTIMKSPKFNSRNSIWEFYLVGNRFDTSGYIEQRLISAKNHGEKSLVTNVGNYKIYVKTWREIIDNVEVRHKFLQDVLELEKDKLIQEENLESANDIIKNASKLTSVRPEAVVKTKKQSRRPRKSRK